MLEKMNQMLESVNPWMPTTNVLDLKILGKALEESGEYAAALSRCLIQGIDESEPTTKKLNKRWLEEEGADIMATLWLVIEHFNLDYQFMLERSLNKAERLQTWHKMDENGEQRDSEASN